MSEEHLRAMANNLKEEVLFDSQVANEKEYRFVIVPCPHALNYIYAVHTSH